MISPESQMVERPPGAVKSFSCNVTHANEEDVYSTVEKFREEIFPGLSDDDLREEPAPEATDLSGIINLHNVDEIQRRTTSLTEMREKIEAGSHVLMPDGLPNVKVARTGRNELVCFDGHHSLLAYMMAGRTYLQEVPHLLVTGSSGKGIKDEEVHAFFGDHAGEIRDKNWRNYTISWTNSPEGQLEKRKQENMGELLSDLLSDGYRN